jgi:sucrose-6-phosphate hydrolase SacC (GH32 family)
VVVGLTSKPLELYVDRRRSRRRSFHKDYPGRHAGPVRWRDDKIALRVFFDRSLVEIFANDGETVITERVYPTQPLDRLELLPANSDGRTVTSARLWTLRSVWPQK